MYTARISRSNPTAFVILIDQSGSMSEKTIFEGQIMTKAEAVALIVDMMIEELMLRSRKEDHYNDYFDIAVLGYGDGEVRPLLKSPSGSLFLTPSQLDGAHKSSRQICYEQLLPSSQSAVHNMEHRVWVVAAASGDTPMYEALSESYGMVKQWIDQHRDLNCFPPMVINITDGEASDATDADLKAMASQIKQLSTMDGNVLLMNIHICATEEELSVLFPCSVEELPDRRYAHQLFEMSSTMPDVFNEYINGIRETDGQTGFRAMSFNTDMHNMTGVLNVGSVSLSLI